MWTEKQNAAEWMNNEVMVTTALLAVLWLDCAFIINYSIYDTVNYKFIAGLPWMHYVENISIISLKIK